MPAAMFDFVRALFSRQSEVDSEAEADNIPRELPYVPVPEVPHVVTRILPTDSLLEDPFLFSCPEGSKLLHFEAPPELADVRQAS